MIATIVILSVLLLISLFIIRNLLLKVEKSEDIMAGYLVYLDQISRVIELSKKRIEKVSLLEAFKSDDEIGFFFKQIEDIQNYLNKFILKEK